MTTAAVSAAGVLRTFNDAKAIDSSDVHVAQRLTSLVGDTDERVELAVALVGRGLRGGSGCGDLRAIADQIDIPEMPWPDPEGWSSAVQASGLAESKVLRYYDGLLYFDRY